MAMIDSEFGRYDPEARLVKLPGVGWHCEVCNSMRRRVPRMLADDGGAPLCEVCQERKGLDAELAAGVPAERLHARIARKRWGPASAR